MSQFVDFWKSIKAVQQAAIGGDFAKAEGGIKRAFAAGTTGDKDFEVRRREIVSLLARTYNLTLPAEKVDMAQSAANMPQEVPLMGTAAMPTAPVGTVDLGPITEEGAEGVSLVTCAMNRTDNLLKAMKTWLACPDISEVVIVDWSSEEPVREAVAAAGFDDPRVRVIRVNDEPRWILSFAFNIGFRVARCKRILKADADITLSPDFFARNLLDPGCFIAGNWRKATEGQSHVNGFFYLHKSDLAAVGGFNEFITTYGWDDDDIYERLTIHGADRRDVDPDTILHLDHSDAERIGGAEGQGVSARDEIAKGTMYRIRRNRFLANVMPYWDNNKTPLPLQGDEDTGGHMRLSRTGWLPNPVPTQVDADADYYALLEMTAWRLGRRVLELDRAQLQALTNLPFSQLSMLTVEVLLASPAGTPPAESGYLVVDLLDDTPTDTNAAGQALTRLVTLATRLELSLVVRADTDTLPAHASDEARNLTYVPMWKNIGTQSSLTVEALLRGAVPPAAARVVCLALDAAAISALIGADTSSLPAAPAVAPRRARLFIDAQHGLGNRLRAIGSAGAVAAKTDRELVVVWEPDHHCEGLMSDLYDYDGAVIEEAFVSEAADKGCHVFNYMEIEDGSEKDAWIPPEITSDLYVRSAYVLNSPHSDWEAENRFLQELSPVAAVRDLVASVRTPNDLSAHVRMVGAPGSDTASYDRAENWTEEGHAELHQWREKSHFSHFLKRIDALVAEGRADRIFLAADKPETYDEFQRAYGDRLAVLPRTLYDRSAEQLHYALADALLLGSAPLLLGSTWSSFSELAMRLSPQNMTIEMSGTDF